MRHFLSYWKPTVADANLQQDGNHTAGEQFARVTAGDTVWIVTVRSGRLFLLTRIVVGQVTDQATAERVLGTDDLWKASFHVIAANGTAEPIRDIEITHLAEQLRFESRSERTRLVVTNGRVNAQQLQQMRVLRPSTVGLLEEALGTDPVATARARDSRKNVARLPEELPQGRTFFEGAVRTVQINAYERNPAARRACIARWDTICCVCRFDFARAYGHLGRDYMHVHHLTALCDIREEYKLDPIRDLRPICPNCHAMIHRRDPALTIEKLRRIVQKQRDRHRQQRTRSSRRQGTL